MSKTLKMVKEVLDEALANYPVDRNRIYIAGLSMGGMGTFDMLCRYPDLFAAAIPICGGVDTGRLERVDIKTHLRIFMAMPIPLSPLPFPRSLKVLKRNG